MKNYILVFVIFVSSFQAMAGEYISHEISESGKARLEQCRAEYESCREDSSKKVCKRRINQCVRSRPDLLSCREIYVEKYGDAHTYNSRGGLILAALLTIIAPPVGAVMLIIAAIQDGPKRDTRLERAENQSRKVFKRGFKKDERERPSNNVYLYEMKEIVKRGFESGDFCEDYPKLKGPRKVRKYIREKLSSVYGVETNIFGRIVEVDQNRFDAIVTERRLNFDAANASQGQ